MVSSLARRGPDGSGVHAWTDAILGHRRLAIFDLTEAGRQPFLSADRSIGLVFNGAIYNFVPLRAELEGQGCAFVSRTDTEVLVHGYRVWGIDGLVRRIQGMFAFAIWDDSARRLYLVRDRLGVKPLIYAVNPQSIAFASTARALQHAGYVDELDPAAVAEFLEYGYVTDSRTIYQGAQKLPAATILEWSPTRGVTTRQYWRSPDVGTTPSLSFDEAVEQTEVLLLKATETRLQADVPVGALLSGGIDSGLVCWAMRELGANITAYTVGTPRQPGDETEDAIATARELGIRHEVLPLSDTEPASIDLLVAAYGEPFACSSALGMLRVSEAIARSSAKVLLTGDGGDDVFLGYPRHRQLLRIQQAARVLPPAATGAWRATRQLIPHVGVLRRGVHLVDYVTGGLGGFVSATDGLPGYRRQGLLGSRLADAVVDARRIPWSIRSARNVLTEYLAYDLRTQFVAEYLTKVDGATMYHALEARSPFFDQNVWEFAARTPYELRLHNGELKAILRAIATRRVSRRLAAGRKRGFDIPAQAWIAGRWRGAVEGLFENSIAEREGWLKTSAALELLRGIPPGGRAPLKLWYMSVLEAWLRAEEAQRQSAREAPLVSGSAPH